MSVIGYVRVSTSGKAKDGYSLAYHQDEIRSYCREQGWNLLHIYIDSRISGSKVDEDTLEVDRIGFQSMLFETIDVVIVLQFNKASDLVQVKRILDRKAFYQRLYSTAIFKPRSYTLSQSIGGDRS